MELFLSKSFAKLVLLTFRKVWSFSKQTFCLIEKQHCTIDGIVELTARWPNQKTKNVRNIFLIGEKALMLLIKKNQNWMTATWGVPERSTKVNFLSRNKEYLPKVPDQLELSMFSEDKSVAALKGKAENKENPSVATQNWLTAMKLVVNFNKTAGYHGQLLSIPDLLMMLFRKKKRFLDEKWFLQQTFQKCFFARTLTFVGKEDVSRKGNRWDWNHFPFKTCAFFVKLSSSSNFPTSDFLSKKFRIRMKVNLREQYSIGNPQQICHSKVAYLKNNNTLLMFLLNLRHGYATKDQICQEHLLDCRKAFDATDHEISDWMTVTWGVPQRST